MAEHKRAQEKQLGDKLAIRHRLEVHREHPVQNTNDILAIQNAFEKAKDVDDDKHDDLANAHLEVNTKGGAFAEIPSVAQHLAFSDRSLLDAAHSFRELGIARGLRVQRH